MTNNRTKSGSRQLRFTSTEPTEAGSVHPRTAMDGGSSAVRIDSDAPLPCRLATRPRRQSVFQTSVRGVLVAVQPRELLIQPDRGSLARLRNNFPHDLPLERLLNRRVSLDLAHGANADAPGSDRRLWDEDGRLALWALEGMPPRSTPMPGVRLALVSSPSSPLLEVRAPRLRTLLSAGHKARIPSAVRSFEIRVHHVRADGVSLIATPF